MLLNSGGYGKSCMSGCVSILLSLLLAMALITGCGDSGDDDDGGGGTGIQTVVLDTDDGAVACLDGVGMVSCKGIPYALPPTGTRRFAPPEEITSARSETLNATAYGNTCPQVATDFGDRSETEDCLFLNVFIPKDGTDGPYPVMVWLHGGAFVSGTAGTETYDPYNPANLVAEGVVVVTVNYRLGALGFLPHAALTNTSSDGQSGNYGLMDQHMALEWVQDHIDDFDGDSENVTLFGESAGGHSVLSHLVAPSSFAPRALFHQAIIQSGAYTPSQWNMTQGYTYYGTPFATLAGCTSGDDATIAACLRDLSVSDILDAQDQISMWPSPVYAGTGAFLEQSIATVLADDGIPDDVPVIMGSNKDEGQLFTVMELAQGTYYLTRDEYDTSVAATLALSGLDAGAVGQHYLDHYASTNPNLYREAIGELWTDYMFVYNNKVIWDLMSDATNVYAYWFTDEEAPLLSSEMELALNLLSIGATHGFEIQYVFGNLGDNGATANQITLSDTMIGYWTNFAKTGVPDASWETYVVGDEVVLQLDDPTPTVTDVYDTVDGFCDTHECDYWDGLFSS